MSPKTLLKTYIHESHRPDCDPDMRFRATLPTGFSSWHPTRQEAERAISDAATTILAARSKVVSDPIEALAERLVGERKKHGRPLTDPVEKG